MTNEALGKMNYGWLQRKFCKVVAGVGLILILGSILYLLAGFSAALDAISFQGRVLRVVGDDNHMQARSVLNKLDQLRRSEPSDRPMDAEALPIETLALQLDRVKATTTLLGSFKDAIQSPEGSVDPDEQARKQSEIIKAWLSKTTTESPPEQEQITELLRGLELVDENGSASTDTEDLMRNLGNSLKNEMERLDKEISINVRGIRLVRSLDKIQSVLEQFETNKASLLDDNPAADQFKERLAQLEGYLGDLENIMPATDAERVIAKQHLKNAFEAFNDIRPLTNGSTVRIESNLDSIYTSLATIKANLSEINILVAEPKPEALNELFGKLQADAEKIQESLAEDDPNIQELEDPLAELGKQREALATHIKTTLPEFETIQKITPALAQMEITSNVLSRMAVDSKRINVVIDGELVNGSKAANFYDTQVDALSKAVDSMTKSLEELSDLGLLAQLLDDDPEAMAKAGTLLRDHENISRAEFPLSIGGLKLIDPAVLAVASREKLDIMMVLIVGAIGSMIYMTQRMLKMIMHGQDDDLSQRMPFLWFLARPVFGAVVAFAAYLIYQTGQIAFGTGGLTEALQNGINIPILTAIGLFAGLLSWQALDMIQSKGEVWLKSGTHKPLWATGLARMLEAKGQSDESCSQHLGVTIGQVDRWICHKDKVVPEMQDRLSTWLGVKSEELFSDTSLVARTQNQAPMYAVGLKPFLQRIDAHHKIESIARALGVKDEMVERWRDQRQPVAGEFQWQLVELVNCRFAQFYSTKGQNDQNWAVKLRISMSISQYPNSTALASKLHISEEWVRKWRELYEPVPAPTARLIAETLQDDVHELFDSHFDRLRDQFLIANTALEEAIVAKYIIKPGPIRSVNLRKAVPIFAEEMDVSVKWVDDWLKGRKPLFNPTRKAAADKLGKDEEALFTRYTSPRDPSPGDGTRTKKMRS